jgi:prepilin-type N-terminal cleavage/methylation domain-containing protein
MSVFQEPITDAKKAAPRDFTAEAGFTLIEVLIAIIILVTGMMAIANLYALATVQNTAANSKTAAVDQASQALELLKAIPFQGLVAGGSLTADLPATYTVPAGGWPTITNAANALNQYNMTQVVPGVGTIVTRWTVTATVNPDVFFIDVVAAGSTFKAGTDVTQSLSRVEFTTFRGCSVKAAPVNCP